MTRIALTLSCFALMVACAPAGEENTEPAWDDIIHEGVCDQADFTTDPGMAVFGRKLAKQYLGYEAAGSGSRYDKIEFTSFLLADETEPLPEGSYILDASDGAEAEPLVRAFRDCDDDGQCNEIYQATGVLKIVASGVEGDTFKARLDNVTFEEMEQDGSEPKRRGTTFCGSNVRWDEPIESNILGECVAEGEGNQRGDKLADLVLPNCYGDPVAIHDNCGRVKAQVLVMTAGWCSACRARLPQTESLISQYKDQGQLVEAYYVIGQGNSTTPATMQDCFSDAQAKGIDPARMLLDNGNGRAGFNQVWRRNWLETCDRSLPNYYVLDGDDMSFNFASRCDDDPRAQTGYSAAIEELLDD